MLIKPENIIQVLDENNIKINGALHVGAHNCEELKFYSKINLKNEDVIWIEAIPMKVNEARNKGIPNVYHGVITDKNDEIVNFNVANNIQSSSVLPFGTHAYEHPQVKYIQQIQMKTITIDKFVQDNNIDPVNLHFWNFDIQGAELMALKGAINTIKYAKAMYLEVNEKELYQKCGLIGEIDEFLNKYNFKRVLTNMTHHGWGDALYIRV